jgi:hypothetical protein
MIMSLQNIQVRELMVLTRVIVVVDVMSRVFVVEPTGDRQSGRTPAPPGAKTWGVDCTI